MSDKFNVYLEFAPALRFFLHQGCKSGTVQKQLSHATSVKDVVESFGVPHTEVGKIKVNGETVGFGYHMSPGDRVTVSPVDPASFGGFGLQPEPGDNPAFIADEHLAKLVRRMRVLGFDTHLFSGGSDRDLLALMHNGNRILLTRDRRLLMHNIVRSGYCIRSSDVFQQVCEVVRRYCLAGRMQPFSRCPSCNGKLEAADKISLLNRLEPKTRRYYWNFFLCDSCGKIFWRGSHAEKLESFVAAVREGCNYSEL